MGHVARATAKEDAAPTLTPSSGIGHWQPNGPQVVLVIPYSVCVQRGCVACTHLDKLHVVTNQSAPPDDAAGAEPAVGPGCKACLSRDLTAVAVWALLGLNAD